MNMAGTSRRGFAAMDPDKQRKIASRGGSMSGGNFKNDPQRASDAGRKGGKASHRGRNTQNMKQSNRMDEENMTSIDDLEVL